MQKVVSEETPILDSSFLLNPNLTPKLHLFSTFPIISSRFVVYGDFNLFLLEHILGPLGPPLSSTNNLVYYPELMWYFYTNLSVENENETISSMVKGVSFTFDESSLGVILNLPSEEVKISDLQLNSKATLEKIHFSPNSVLPWTFSKLQPIPRLISRILSYNILLKLGSFYYFSKDLSHLVYVVYSFLPINYATVVFSFLVHHHHHKFLPFGFFLTQIFQHFCVPLEGEMEMRLK